MPVMYLVGAAQHKLGKHRVHIPVLDNEGRPLRRDELPQGAQTVKTIEFVDGRADVPEVGYAKWLREKGHAAEVEVPAFGLRQPGKAAVVQHDEAGNPVVVEPAQPAELPGAKPEKK